MPIYVYICDNDHEFEEWGKITESPVAECPKCQAPCKRLISMTGPVIFKGSGWNPKPNSHWTSGRNKT